MKTLVALINKLDRVFDEKAEDGEEPVYLCVNGEMVPLTEVSCERDSRGGLRVMLKGETQ